MTMHSVEPKAGPIVRDAQNQHVEQCVSKFARSVHTRPGGEPLRSGTLCDATAIERYGSQLHQRARQGQHKSQRMPIQFWGNPPVIAARALTTLL